MGQGWATNPRRDYPFAPQGEVTKHAPGGSDHRLSTNGSKTQFVIWLEELNQPNAEHANLLDSDLQIGLCWHTKHDQVTGFIGPVEPLSCLEARMSNLDKLLRQRNVRPTQDVSV